MNKRGRIVLLAVLGMLLLSGVFAWRRYRDVFAPNKGDGEKILYIPSGADLRQVIDSLAALDVLRDTAAFRWTAERKKYAGRVKPGRYIIPPGITNNALVNKLRSGEQDPVRITFTNIRHLPQLAGRIADHLECDSLDMLAAMRAPANQEKYGFTAENMISMFIPNTYEVWWTETPDGILARMAREYDRFWTEERRSKAASLGLSLPEVSTLASIVQGETAKPDEAPKVAGLYLNRLRIGMALQADPTLVFAGELEGVNRILDADKAVDSPYNTYLHTGLPPGPIRLPEPRYIDAVLNPEQHDYLFMCARADLSGYHDMAKTYQQHLVNARRYQRALDKQGTYR